MLKKIQNSFLIAEIGWNFLGNLKLAEKNDFYKKVDF
jgi:hypothetical protein